MGCYRAFRQSLNGIRLSGTAELVAHFLGRARRRGGLVSVVAMDPSKGYGDIIQGQNLWSSTATSRHVSLTY